MANTDRLSVYMSLLLDSMGFSRHMIDFRINNASYGDVIGTLTNKFEGQILTGGKADGTSKNGQGDTDTMWVGKLIIVSGRHIDPPSPHYTVLYTEDKGVHHGYTWLRMGHPRVMDTGLRQCLVLTESANSALYLSSFVFKQIRTQRRIQYRMPHTLPLQISGPALSSLCRGKPNDSVEAFMHPEWPAQASQWMERCRRNGWPPESTVTAIANSGCYIVPKGFKGSPSEHMEWCISFAVHEKSIIQLFNLTQKHVYILLKIIAKDLREHFPDLQDLLTSYTMKTVALWQVEHHHTRDWDRSHLLDRLIEALYFLKSSVENQNLPAYFIMENNLFDGKINVFKAEFFSRLLNDLLSQGAGCVLTLSSIQQRLQIMYIPALEQRLDVCYSGVEMNNLINATSTVCCHADLSERHILNVLPLIDSPNMSRHLLLRKGISKIMKTTLAYINIAKIKKMEMSDRRKYELYRPWLCIASANIDTDRMSGRVKFAGVLRVLGKINNSIETLYSVKPRPLFGISRKIHYRSILRKKYRCTKTDSDYIEAVITRLGRDQYVQKCVTLDVEYTIEEIDIVPDVIKYELFHVPKFASSHFAAIVDADVLRYYLLYRCHTDLGNKSNSHAAFINLIRIATQERYDPYMEHREVALNVLGLCYLEKKDYLRGYICFCRAMSLRPRLLKEEWSTSTPWHLAVLVSKLINRPQVGCPSH